MIIRLTAATLSLLLAGTAAAQEPTPPASGPTAKTARNARPATPSLAATGANTTGHSGAAIECSTQADAKALHGKARDKFRSSCKAAAKKG